MGPAEWDSFTLLHLMVETSSFKNVADMKYIPDCGEFAT
jgi:hypothetical protein